MDRSSALAGRMVILAPADRVKVPLPGSTETGLGMMLSIIEISFLSPFSQCAQN